MPAMLAQHGWPCTRRTTSSAAASVRGRRVIIDGMDRLRDRVILITGSTGIAAAAAERCVAEGASVFVTSRTADHARGLAERLGAAWAQAELTEEAEVGAAVTAAVERFGRIDGLFSVAGGSGRRFGDGPIHTVTGDAWEATAALNLRTQVLVCAAVVRQMLQQTRNASGTRGSVLLMGSVTTTDPAPELFATHAYAAAKGALTALMTTMAATYAPDGIRVNIVAPSLARTPMAKRAADDPAILAYARRKQPLAGEMLHPDEVAQAAIYFLSDESRAVTGQMLKVDGGWSVTSVSPDPKAGPESDP
jgi:NAD(P)-dependent dehydrogenase (short-subunit alcohol dehydrogenase family)